VSESEQGGLRFKVSEFAVKMADAWRTNHEAMSHDGKPPYAGAIGGAYQWKFTPTSLGVTIVFRCMCGEEINLTDFSEW
jgi:hypothetical protein